MKILIVEDDTDSRVLLERGLSSQGYQVESAANGALALELVRLAPPGLIISDIMMPEMDGFELCRRIKTDEALRHIPFVFYTATFIEPKDEQLCMGLGASRFLVKPMAPDQLFHAIAEIVDGHRETPLPVPERSLDELNELTGMQMEAMSRKLDKKLQELEQERERLRQTEERLNTLIRTIPDLVWLKDGNGVYLSCNPRFERFFGAKEAEIIGKTDYDFVPRELADFFRQKDHAAMAAGKPTINEEEVVFADDGHRELLETIKTPMFDSQGRLIGVLGIARDITALRQSEQRYRRTFENMQDVVFVSDRDGTMVDVSPSVTMAMGYSREEVIGQPALSFYFAPEDRQAMLDALERQGSLRDFVVRLRSKDGALQYAALSVHFILDQAGRRCGIEGLIRIVTEHKKMEDAIRESEERFRLALERLPIAIGIADTHGRVHYVNDQFTVLFGYTLEDIPTLEAWLERAYPDAHYRARTISQWRADVVLASQGGDTTPVREYHITCKNGELRQVELITRPVGERLVTSFNDLTEHNALEGQLRQAQKMEAIGQVAGGVAHDFNNILTAIIGYSTFAKMGMAADDPNHKHLEQVLAAADRAVVLTQSLLAFSRKQVTNPTLVDLNEVVASFKKFLRRLLREDVTLSTAIATETLPVIADRGQIEQVLMNLVTNARDAMPGGGRIGVETGRLTMDQGAAQAHGFAQGGDYATVVVRDTGGGIPEAIRHKIFDPFFTTKEVGKGTGLGLSMVYGIVKKHQGEIGVESTLGQGTTFTIYLPLAGQGLEVEPPPGADDAPLPRGTETILVAEDDAALRSLVVSFLGQYGYTVLAAADGAAAVRLFQEHQEAIRLVLLDGIMPNMNGMEAWRKIVDLRPQVKAVFMSGYAEDVFTREGIPEKGALFLEKPIALSELLLKLRQVLDG